MDPPAIPPKPKGRDRRIMFIVAGVAALGLVLLLRARQGAGQAAPAQPAQPDWTAAQQTPPSTFADNGAAAAASLDQVTAALGGQSDAISAALSQQSQDIAAALGGLAPSGDGTVTSPVAQEIGAEAGLITALAAAMQPAGSSGGTVARAPSKNPAASKRAPSTSHLLAELRGSHSPAHQAHVRQVLASRGVKVPAPAAHPNRTVKTSHGKSTRSRRR